MTYKDGTKIWAFLFPVFLLAIGLAYYFIDPESKAHLIQCPWRLLTGTKCPSCGVQRALHALMHGGVKEALNYNYFFILSIPYALSAVAVSWYNFGHKLDKLKRLVFHKYTLYAYVTLFFVWWIVRNIFDL